MIEIIIALILVIVFLVILWRLDNGIKKVSSELDKSVISLLDIEYNKGEIERLKEKITKLEDNQQKIISQKDDISNTDTKDKLPIVQ